MVMSESFLRALREGVEFLEHVWRVARGWDQGGDAGCCGKEKMGFIGGVSAMGGRIGAVGTCDGMSVDLRVEEGWRRRQEGGWEARWRPCARKR